MKQLRIHVERIVRPISANFRRKDQMREELLAHLMGLYEQERESGNGAAPIQTSHQALQLALERFGDPVQIRRELQDSVPPLERIVFFQFDYIRWFSAIPGARAPLDFVAKYRLRRPGESVMGHAGRLSCYFVAVMLLFFLPLLILNFIVRVAKEGAYEKLLFLATFAFAIATALSLACFLCVLIGHGVHRALDDWFRGKRSWRRVVGYAVLSSLTVLLSGCVFWLLVSPNLMPRIVDLLLLLGISLVMPLVILLMVRFGLAEFRRFGEWGSLKIEE